MIYNNQDEVRLFVYLPLPGSILFSIHLSTVWSFYIVGSSHQALCTRLSPFYYTSDTMGPYIFSCYPGHDVPHGVGRLLRVSSLRAAVLVIIQISIGTSVPGTPRQVRGFV